MVKVEDREIHVFILTGQDVNELINNQPLACKTNRGLIIIKREV